MTDFIATSSPGSLTTTVAKIDDKIKKLPASDPLSKYRKKHGTMEKCLKQPGTASVMQVEGNNVKFNDGDAIIDAHTNGVLTDAAFAKYQKAQIEKKGKSTKNSASISSSSSRVSLGSATKV